MLAACLIVGACASGQADDTTDESSPNSLSNGTDGSGSELRFEGPTEAITVERVSDGDSLRALGPDGALEVRLLGVNSPEGDECLGPEAKSALESMVANGERVELGPWPGERDEFGRTLGFVIVDDRIVNLAMIEQGLAVARAQSEHGLVDEFEDAEQRASDAGRGIWAPDACGPASDAELSIVEVFANAPGDDRQNPNGEWVLFRNDGAAAVELAGWSLRDESTRHRYDFPDITIEAGVEFRVRSGCGDDDLDVNPIELFWCDPEPPIWNNDGDTAFLLDPNGGTADNLRSS